MSTSVFTVGSDTRPLVHLLFRDRDMDTGAQMCSGGSRWGSIRQIYSRRADMGKYCNYCHDYGHNTNVCSDLRHAIQQLIDDGKIPISRSWTTPTPRFTDADLPNDYSNDWPLSITLVSDC
uniref:Uncharacterized protein n=1 Tax=Chenopodium quinoa TaxID=63459 RepID=A0A803MY79_CHEQI